MSEDSPITNTNEPTNASDALSAGLKKAAPDAQLSDEARLRLYEKFNEERARRGESLLKIPADLLARVKAKAAAAPDAAKKAAAGSKESASLAASSGTHFAKATGQGGKRFGGKMKQGTVNATRNAADVARELGRTVADVGRITTVESYEVLREAPQSKRKALLAPPKLAGKGMKAGIRLMTGTAKAAAKTVKGGAVMTKDAASTTATGMIESARMGKAFAESSDKIMEAGDALARGVKDAAKELSEKTDEQE
jgi:hypothetical protein